MTSIPYGHPKIARAARMPSMAVPTCPWGMQEQKAVYARGIQPP